MSRDGALSQDAPGTLVVRVTLNAALARAAFARDALLALWAGAGVVFVVALVLSGPADASVLVIAALIVGWCVFVLVQTGRAVRRKQRVLSMGVPTLVLDDVGVTVRDVPVSPDPTHLAWADCSAVVISRAPRGHGFAVQPRRYVQFVAVSDDRIEGRVPRRDPRREAVAGVSDRGALLVWLELPGLQPDADDVATWLRERRPDLRLVGAGHSASDE